MKKERVDPLLALRKETPPPRRHGGRRRITEKYADALEKIAAEPGEWFAMLDYGDRSTTAGGQVQRMRVQRPDFEFTARNGVVYARFPDGEDGRVS